jgi:glycosyltransferase involved in cell wall biosynthesis
MTMKILYVTTIGLTMCFFKDFIHKLIKDGNQIDIASNENEAPVPDYYREWGCKINPLSCSRSPFSKGNLTAVAQIKKLVEEKDYDMVHCHTPIAAACTRIACRKLRKKGVRVLYTAHGFHFYKGAPLINWLLYYPVEKLLSNYTDVLITINREDYELAQRKMNAKKVCLVPGVGVDTEKYGQAIAEKSYLKKELSIPDSATVLLSVGELNDNKNHAVLIRALAKANAPLMHYCIAGTGALKPALELLAESLNISKQVHFLGYRNDIPALCKASDIFCFSSKREGLPVSLMEAMAAGLPCVASDIRGNRDLIIDGEGGFLVPPEDVDGFTEAIVRLTADREMCERMGAANRENVRTYDIANVMSEMREIYKEALGDSLNKDKDVVYSDN